MILQAIFLKALAFYSLGILFVNSFSMYTRRHSFASMTVTKFKFRSMVILNSYSNAHLDSTAEDITRRWAYDWIIKNKFCPWASKSVENDKLRVIRVDTSSVDNTRLARVMAIDIILKEAFSLIDEKNTDKITSTLVIVEYLQDFDKYLKFYKRLEKHLAMHNLHNHVQVLFFFNLLLC